MSYQASFRLLLLSVGVTITLPHVVHANPPAQDSAAPVTGQELEDVRSVAIEAYAVKRGLRPRADAALAVRERIEDFPPGLEMAISITGQSVAGTVEIPVIPLQFANTTNPPYPVANLQTELFSGPWPTGTMTEHYRELSGGKFTVNGEVFSWTKVSRDDVFYSGPPGCNGMCNNARIGDLLTEALQKIDANTDFRRFDNDGPDNVPNSGDDDGFVDFVAFVHPESGGECTQTTNNNIWSHRYSLQSWTGQNFQTNDPGKLGTNILVDDYVIMPAFACDLTTMIQIGVFSHEFGHAFGLPDLYDARKPYESEGVGGWDLMAAGSWGGMGSTPQTPSHMSAWSKEYLGWVTPRVIETDQKGVTLEPVQHGDVVKVEYTDAADPADQKYLLLEYRVQEGFDKSIAKSGLLVTEINNVRVQGGLGSNTVNDLPLDMGVNVIEADGKRELDRKVDRGDEGDVFPGADNVASVDGGHAERISAALCNIVLAPQRVTFDVFVSRTTCPSTMPQAAISPSEAMSGKLRGEDVVIEGVLSNQGSNYFTDRKLVVTGEGGANVGGEVIVTVPAPLEMPGAESTPPSADTLSDLLDKKVILRGKLQKQVQKGVGLTDVFVVEEVQIVE